MLQVERVVRVPLTPPGALGLTNLRGASIAVVDLAAVQGLQVGGDGAPIDGTGPALVVRLQGMRTAASIEMVDSVLPVRSNAIKESDAVGEHPAIAGFLPLAGGGVVSVVDTVVPADHVLRLRLRQSTDNGRGDGSASELAGAPDGKDPITCIRQQPGGTVDTFDLITIRDAFEADVTRYVRQA